MRIFIFVTTLVTLFARVALAVDPSGAPGSSGVPQPTSANFSSTETAVAGTPPASPSGYLATVPPTQIAAPAPDLKGPSALGILSYSGGYGIGVRFALPLGIGSILNNPTVRDGFAAEFAFDYIHWSESNYAYNWSYQVYRLAGGIMWDIWLSNEFAIYPKVELGYSRWSYNGMAIYPNYSPLFLNGAAGAMYKVTAGLVVRAEIGYAGLALGAGWMF
jgi:hypothetical protein